MTLNVGEVYTEKGATAKDDKDGDITSSIQISGNVNTSKAGTYTVKYTVKNSLGKQSTKTRTIIVKAKESTPTTPTTPSKPTTPSTPTKPTTPTTNTTSGGTTNNDKTDDKDKDKDKEKEKENKTP